MKMSLKFERMNSHHCESTNNGQRELRRELLERSKEAMSYQSCAQYAKFFANILAFFAQGRIFLLTEKIIFRNEMHICSQSDPSN